MVKLHPFISIYGHTKNNSNKFVEVVSCRVQTAKKNCHVFRNGGGQVSNWWHCDWSTRLENVEQLGADNCYLINVCVVLLFNGVCIVCCLFSYTPSVLSIFGQCAGALFFFRIRCSWCFFFLELDAIGAMAQKKTLLRYPLNKCKLVMLNLAKFCPCGINSKVLWVLLG